MNTAIFIITHGRPDNQITFNTLKELGCTIPVYLVVDDEDKTQIEYGRRYGSRVIVFHKDRFIRNTETGLCVPLRNFAVFARNACEFLARKMDLDTFMILDDDIPSIRFRSSIDGVLKSFVPRGYFSKIFRQSCEYVRDCKIGCLAFGYSNSYRAGASALDNVLPRQQLCALAFLRNTSIPVEWRLNTTEDLITSIDAAQRGEVWFQFLPIQVDVVISEGKVSGGNSEVYNTFGKYRVAFFPVIPYPSCNTARFVNNHWVTTTVANDCVPKIISSKYKLPI